MTTIVDLPTPDLARDPGACRAVKDEVVDVRFADQDGLLMSAVGPNHYAAGDALLVGSTGDPWCVTRDRFDAKYRPEPGGVHGQPGKYRNIPSPVFAKRMPHAFTVARRAGGDRLRGEAGDWLVEYAPGDHGIVAQDRFAAVYRVVGPSA